MRGRGNNNNNNNNHNRKGPNPLTRSYESNGPDVKIRGSAQQVAEKYTTLARDAQSAGDRVMAENYLQHAEHYNRIIATALAQQAQQAPRDFRDDNDDDGDDDGVDNRDNRDNRGHQQHAVDADGPQPEINGIPAEVALNSNGDASFNGEAQHVNGAPAQAEAAEGDAPPKRARRGRRPRQPREGQPDLPQVGEGGDAPAEAVGQD
jgi:hypothetical protein